ncbi:glycosyltransferase family 9 protein [Leucobacter sp. CSA1]|uniref:Glycosyltransferase family 9 protein n=1 Tax=Leucobacter chromiisoli TaxID=2796471 RepID=A0A934QAQ7_9MICO|nr:glycosyltransferase family 9 protein [Leucobacter chromiisoli]MBK0419724.1 glycosyltransferase family 9 protein [Leucobacter chromiisoli]
MTRVLVARLDSVGDVLLSGPAVRAIAAGADEVWMLCGPTGAPAAELLPGVDRVLTWAAPWIVSPAPPFTPESAEELAGLIAECRPDSAVILTSFHQSPLPLAAMLRLAGVSRIAGASVDHAGSLLDVRLTPGEDFPEDQPEALRALAIAGAAGFPAPPDDRLAVRDLPDVSDLVPDGPYVVVHPGASVPAREWPAGHHRRLTEELSERGRTVLVTGTPAEAELTARVAGSRGIDLGGRTDLHGLAGILAGADAAVVGNTGPAHLAAAVGTPIVSLFSPVVPAVRWAPWGVPTIVLGDQEAACRGSRARVCPVPGHPCLSQVDPATVADACERLISETEGAQR